MSTILTIITVAILVAKFKAAYEAGELDMKYHSFKSTLKDIPWLEEQTDGMGRDIASITHADIEDLLDRVRFGKNRRGEEMSEAGAASVYYSLRRLFAWAVDMGFLTESPFEKVAWDAIPRVTSKKKVASPTFTEDQGKAFVKAMINVKPTYSAIKACLFAYLAYRYEKTPGELLIWKWTDYEAFIASANDPFLVTLVANYREALNKWLTDHNVINVNNYFWVKNKYDENKIECESEPMDSGFVGTWLKDNILKPGKLPLVTVNKLCSSKIERDVFEEIDAGVNFPIHGTITFPKAFGTGGPHYDHEAYKASTDKRRAAFEAKNKSKIIKDGEEK